MGLFRKEVSNRRHDFYYSYGVEKWFLISIVDKDTYTSATLSHWSGGTWGDLIYLSENGVSPYSSEERKEEARDKLRKSLENIIIQLIDG